MWQVDLLKHSIALGKKREWDQRQNQNQTDVVSNRQACPRVSARELYRSLHGKFVAFEAVLPVLMLKV